MLGGLMHLDTDRAGGACMLRPYPYLGGEGGVLGGPAYLDKVRDRHSGRLGSRDCAQQLGPAVLGPPLVGLARLVGEVVARVPVPAERVQHVERVPESVHGLAAADDGEELAGRVDGGHARRQLLHPAVVVARVGDERQRQAGDFEGEARHRLAGRRLNRDWVPPAEMAGEGAGGERAEDGGDGALAHARRVGRVVLDHARRRRVTKRVRVGACARAN
eukprot:scaffold2244_cov91-Isochrysis_galbana.AAC.2